jgi:hypothetical protein
MMSADCGTICMCNVQYGVSRCKVTTVPECIIFVFAFYLIRAVVLGICGCIEY